MRQRNRLRHCRCADHVIDALLRALPLQGDHPARVRLLAARGSVAAGCPGTEPPVIHWTALEAAIHRTLEETVHRALDGQEELEAEKWVEAFLASGTLQATARKITSSLSMTLRLIYQDARPRNIKPTLPPS